ncbi:MAG: T9SS type A sorting domain-containing protein [Flavobacteriaceae bacterium]|nr:T9SS type A sorting domain-containing protein [Flavobacteriaceae bacterium]
MKKINTYRNISLAITLFLIIFLLGVKANAQSITIEFANAEQTSPDAGLTIYYEADIMISSDIDFYLGSGQVYLNYNTDAFGINISANGGLTYDHGVQGGDCLLDEFYSNSPVYNYFIQNDNTINRVSVSFHQNIGTGSGAPLNVTSTPTKLMHIKILYVNPAEEANISFEENAPFVDLFYTSCGGVGEVADCMNFPGVRIFDDSFDSLNSEPELFSLDAIEELNNLVKLYPNPASKTFSIDTNDFLSEATVTVTDVYGKRINTIQHYSGEPVDVSGLVSGVYFVAVEVNDGKSIKKLLVN